MDRTLTTYQAGAWGAVGAAGALIIAFVLPTGWNLLRGKQSINLEGRSLWRLIGMVIGAVIVLGATLSLGALAALILGSVEIKTAVAAGLGYQGTVNAATRAAGG